MALMLNNTVFHFIYLFNFISQKQNVLASSCNSYAIITTLYIKYFLVMLNDCMLFVKKIRIALQETASLKLRINVSVFCCTL